MLETLVIKNLAVIEKAEINFSPRLNVLTGSTGGGKSLVVAALKLLRGEKGSAKLVRTGAKQCTIDGIFKLGSGERSKAVKELAEEILGEEIEEESLILSRVLDVSGRSKSFIQGRPVPLNSFQRIGAFLLEIHGQGENAMLFKPSIQAQFLDQYGGCSDLRKKYSELLKKAREIRDSLKNLIENKKDLRDKIDLLSFHIDEIEKLAPEPGELAALEKEFKLLSNIEELRENLSEAANILSQNEFNLLSNLGKVEDLVDQAASKDPSLEEALKCLEQGYLLIKEADSIIISKLHSLEADPARLEWVAERIDKIKKLCMKFSKDEKGLLDLKNQMQKELEDLEKIETGEEDLSKELKKLVSQLSNLGRELVKKRRKAGIKLSKEVEKDLKDLGMEKAKLFIEAYNTSQEDILDKSSLYGPGPVEFLLQANPGEEPKPLAKVASGGERARVMLALKKRLADADTVPVVVFDEVDAEVGARLGDIIGRKIKEVSKFHQVICVTHVPQVAAFGDKHFLVEKTIKGERTYSLIKEIKGRERDKEIATMSKGSKIKKKDIEEARKLRKEFG